GRAPEEWEGYADTGRASDPRRQRRPAKVARHPEPPASLLIANDRKACEAGQTLRLPHRVVKARCASWARCASCHRPRTAPPAPEPRENRHRGELRRGELLRADSLRLRERAPCAGHPLGRRDQVERNVMVRHREWLVE